MSGQPTQADVDALRDLLDLMAEFPSNDQRARYLLSSNWMRDRDARLTDTSDARAAGAREALARVEALADRWAREAEERGPDDRVLTGGVAAMLRAALATDTGQEET